MPAHNKMFAQWWRDIKVLSTSILVRLPTWTGRGFERPPMRKHKRWQQLGRLRGQRGVSRQSGLTEHQNILWSDKKKINEKN